MASATPTITEDLKSSSSCSPPAMPTSMASNKTTYVQTEPWAFRAVVQKLTGVPEDSPHKLPVSGPPRGSRAPPPPPPPASLLKRRKLHERRRAPSKLEIKLGPSSARCSRPHHQYPWSSSKAEVAAGGFSSPVSTMDPFFFNVSSPSPTTPSPSSLEKEGEEEEERAMVEKGFYLRPSPRSGGEPPQLLALFPLHSLRDSSPP